MIENDHLGDWSADKDCGLFRVGDRRFDNLCGSPLSETSVRHLRRQSPVLLRTPVTQMIIFNQNNNLIEVWRVSSGAKVFY